MKDILITDFTNPDFRAAFQAYFAEFGVQIRDWDGLFREMDSSGENTAILRMDEEETVGFAMFCPVTLENWFFRARYGFLREFWVKPEHRGRGHGTALLALAEDHFRERGVTQMILTTDTAEEFYLARGYKKNGNMSAVNKDEVFIKNLA